MRLVAYRERIDPAYAADIIRTRSRKRDPDWAKIQRYAQVMQEGKWRFDRRRPICINQQGWLVDGNHRLRAVILSETTQTFIIMEGILW